MVFNKLGKLLTTKFSRKDELSRQLEIVKVFNLYLTEAKKHFPGENQLKPIKLKNQTLTVAVRAAVLASELRMREEEVRARINQALGREVVKRIIYRF